MTEWIQFVCHYQFKNHCFVANEPPRTWHFQKYRRENIMLQTFYENYEIFRLHFGYLNGYRTIIWNSWMATNCFAATQTISIDKYWLYSNVHWNALDENYGDWKVTTLSMNTVVLCRAIQFSTWEKKFLFLMWNVSTSTWDLISIRLGIWYSYVERTNKSKHFFP